ncbi:hypothetical protein CEXT_495881 [Caerostris extrusa]|uniref:Uncharacterized protein n=1 Tax=Caerostris extrusa TaxID=172846 RepID=A0AAV4R214_CAEEX|nr:hypothetical protein CEXT_495881 [Caerostris extrusa]
MEDVKPPGSRSVCSEHVLKYIFASSMKIGFPIYCDAIIPRLEKASLQQKLLEFKIYTRSKSQEIVLNNDSVAHLSKFMSNVEIFIL